MLPTETPRSLLTGNRNRTTCFSPPLLTKNTTVVIELHVGRAWDHIRARIRGMRSGDSSQKSLTTHTSRATKIPQEIIYVVIAHLALDVQSLLACSLTSYSWYIAAAPHLHRTLITQTDFLYGKRKFLWPAPLWSMHKLGLLPVVKTFQFHGGYDGRFHREFSQKRFNGRTLRHFSALTNVQELGIDFLDIPGFMPRIRRYFGHFLPMLRSLALREPKGSCRQIVYFIGLFEHLEDLKLLCNVTDSLERKSADDQALTPLYVPPLQGRLTMMRFTRVELLKEMIGQFGGIRFRWMNLYEVDGMGLLLGASAKTLETLWLHPGDPRGK